MMDVRMLVKEMQAATSPWELIHFVNSPEARRATGCGLRVASHELRVAGCELRVASCAWALILCPEAQRTPRALAACVGWTPQ